MDDNEVMLRTIGVLTEGSDGLAAIRREGAAPHGMSETIAQLVGALFPDISISAETTPAEVLERMQTVVSAGVAQLVTAFVYLHVELAELHDSGRTDITSAAMLRKVALDFSTPSGE